MKIVIKIDDSLVNELAELLGVEPNADAIGQHYADSIAAALAAKQVSKDYTDALQIKSDELKTKISKDK